MKEAVRFEEIENNEAFDEFYRQQNLFSKGFVRCQPGGQIMARSYVDLHPRIQDMAVREDDVFVCSFPKAGTTWTQEMVWNIIHDVDLEAAKATILNERSYFLELNAVLEESHVDSFKEENAKGLSDPVARLELAPSPRVIKTHLSVELLPDQVLKKPRLIYVSRNPRDVVISLYNHWQVFGFYKGDFDGFFNAFLSGVCGYFCPYIPHIRGFWNKRSDMNILFITYEDMKRDITSVIRKVSDFLGKTLSEEQIARLSQHLQFDSMKDNPSVNKEEAIKAYTDNFGGDGKSTAAPGKFMRKGQVGDWKNKLTSEQLTRMQHWEEKELQGSDFSFTFSI